MKAIGFFVAIFTGAILIYGTAGFPDWSDPSSPASSHLSPYYIQEAINDTAVPNLVTAVLGDYRGYDTMFETAVIFSAGLACFYLLRNFRRKTTETRLYRHLSTRLVVHIEEGGTLPSEDSNFERIDSHWTPYDLIIKTTCRLIIPFIQVFGLYVIAHGHYSPGGGFQGGVILGASFILYAIAHDLRSTINRLSEKFAAIFSSIGVLIYAGTGALCLILGGNFLDYSALAKILGTTPIMARYHGILIIEIGVGLAVMTVMVWLYYNISSAGKHKEGI